MSATRYKIWAWGEEATTGVETKYYAGVTVLAKKATSSKYTVINEYICQALGYSVGLPVPACAIIEHDNELYFASLYLNISGHELPPVIPASLVVDKPETALGTALFDIWIGNTDRTTRNIVYNHFASTVHIIDHGHALFGYDGIQEFRDREGQLGIGNNCLIEELKSLVFLDDWCRKFNEVPLSFLTKITEETKSLGLTDEECDACVEYLDERRKEIPNLVYFHRNAFKSVGYDLSDALREPVGNYSI